MDSVTHTTHQVNGINMHVTEKGSGPNTILFLHGFPELWYSWRHQILALSDLGYRCIAPDLRGFGDTDAPQGFDKYTLFNVVGDLVELLDTLVPGQNLFIVGHDWGAYVAWHLCLFRPDKVKGLVSLSVPFMPRNPTVKTIDLIRLLYGDDYYMCRFQEPGEMEAEFALFGARRVVKEFLAYKTPGPLYLPKGNCFATPPESDIDLPSWITEQELDFYASKYEKTGFTGGLNYYRVFNLNWEQTAPWTGAQVNVPAKFITGDLDLVYNSLNTKSYVLGESFKKDVPNLQEVVVLEGVSHWIQQEKPNEISQLIADFIAKFPV